MKKILFNYYVKDLLNSIEQNLLNYQKKGLPESLHHLRLDLKNLNAILSFSQNVYQKKYDANALKPLFDDAGKIREIQMSMQILASIPQSRVRLMNKLKKKENNLSLKFIQNISKYIRRIRNFCKNVCLPEKLPDVKIIKKYFND